MATDKKQAGHLAALRKYVRTPEDMEMVKEMIADGLSDEQILHALGYVDALPDHDVLPNGHLFSNVPTEQEAREAEQGQDLQPGAPVGDVGGKQGEDGDGNDEDVLGHVTGLLNHIAKQKNSTKKKAQ